MSTNLHPQLTDSGDAEIAAYHPLSKLAVAGLICGLLTPAAMIDPFLWLLPPTGIVLGGLALWLLARNAPELIGRKAALIGLVLSTVFGTAAPTQWLGYRWLLCREARQFADAWFELIRHRQPHKAYQFTLHPDDRLPLSDGLWASYRESPYWRGQLKEYVATQPVRTLLELGPQAQIRYYQTEAFLRKHGNQVLYLIYAVTYDDSGEKTTFFVSLNLQRLKLDSGQAGWLLAEVIGGVTP